ncbi:ELMO/CED-12_family protein [Hexamita inflata]|uniref:ELMO/CED-12_family protein n=1 Tax=Hexamita inflata TaxID=28002 RepID=A0ABP1H092_9EUKA
MRRELFLSLFFIVTITIKFFPRIKSFFTTKGETSYQNLICLLNTLPDRAYYEPLLKQKVKEYKIENWADFGFENPNFPQFKDCRALGIEFLLQTNLSTKLKHYLDDDFLELNLPVTINRILQDFIFRFIQKEGEVSKFWIEAEKEVIKFEKYWLKQPDITNNLEFKQKWEQYKQRYWKGYKEPVKNNE